MTKKIALANQHKSKIKSVPKKKKFNGKCNSCSKQGHMAHDCYLDPKNASKQLNWFKATEVNAAGVNKQKKCNKLQLVNID